MNLYQRVLFICLALLSPMLSANPPQQTVKNLFNAMRDHNSKMLLAQFLPNATLQRAALNDEIKTNNLTQFAEFVGSTEKYLDEHLIKVIVQQSDNLAAVWTPYAFYLDNTLSHCGVNSFQLVKVGENWQILSLIDNVHNDDCEAFIQHHRSETDQQ